MSNTDITPKICQDKIITIPNGFKKTAIGIIPEDWEIKSLGQIGELKNGINKDKDQFGFGFPLINLNDVFEINTDHDKEFSLVNSNEKERRDYSLNKGDVLFVRSSVKATGVGLTCVILNDIKDAVYSGFIIRFRDNHFFDLNYKVHCFDEQGFRNRLLAKSTISANININQVALNSLQLPIPPLPEQQKIALILSTWDDAIANCKTTINSIIDRNKGLAQQLLTGKKRLSGFTDKWEENLLKKVIVEYKVKSSTENQYEVLTSSKKGLIKQSEYYNQGRIIDKENKGFNVIPEGFITYRSRSDDSIFTFNQNKFNFTGIVSTYYPVFEFKNCNNNYLVKLLNLNSHKIGRYSVGTSQLVLSLNELKQIKLSFPQIKEQNAIVEVLDIAEKELNSYETKLEALQLQKKGLMQQLLTGKIRVNVK